MFEPLIGSDESQVNGAHNFVVLCVAFILTLWISRVSVTLCTVLDVKSRLERVPCLVLQYFSIYAGDFQLLIRNHFNQVLRMRRTVAPDVVAKQRVLAHLLSETISLEQLGSKVRLQFQVQSFDRATISCNLHWSVPSSSYEDMLFKKSRSPSLPSTDSGYARSSSSRSVPLLDTADCLESMEIRLDLPVASDVMGFISQCDVELPLTQERITEICSTSGVPLAIVLESHSPGDGIRSVYSFCKVTQCEDKISIEVAQQVFATGSSFQEIKGIYGFEDISERDCMICYDNPKNVMLLPCRHCSVCVLCLRSLRDEKCPLCRSPFSSHVVFPPPRASEDKKQTARVVAREPYFRRTQPRQTSRACVRVNPESSDQAEPLLSSAHD